MIARLRNEYKKRFIPEMMEKFKLKNIHEVPKMEKIVINCGVGEAKENPKFLNVVVDEISMITGQRAVKTRAKKSISNFKIRAGIPIGCKVTLRGDIMYEFLDRLVSIALPRVRDFRGVSPKSFDRFGNFSLGIKEHIIFPEIDYDKVEKIHGLDVCIVFKSKSVELSRELLKLLGMPFRS